MRRIVSVLASASVVMSTGGFAVAAAAAPEIGGVQPLLRFVNHRFTSAPTTAQCQQFVGINCYGPRQIEKAYEMPPLYRGGLTGAGQTIAIIDSFGSPTVKRDLRTFDTTFGLPAPPKLSIIQPAGAVPPFDPNDPVMVGWAEETSLDVQYAHAMAPGAKILLVETPVAETEGLGGIPEIVQAENYVIDNHLAGVISQSFGATEQTFPSKAALLAQRSAYKNAKANGVTVLASSGDQGASGGGGADGSTLYTKRVVGWPASDPLVTAVGGTQLHLSGTGAHLQPDNGWNDTNLLGAPASGGGGRSSVFAQPSYQSGVAAVTKGTRGIPDVSLSAAVDGGVLVVLGFLGANSGIYIFGGTSEAAPEFAGIVAVAEQAAGHSLGLLNPALYSLAAENSPAIVPIYAGNNTVTFHQEGRNYTVPGFLSNGRFNLDTGVGTVDGGNLVSALGGTEEG